MDAADRREARWLELGKSECFELLAGQRLGRLAFVDALGPIVLPVNFVVDSYMVVVRTDEGTKLTVAGQGDHVAFEAAPVGARLEEPLPACSPLLTAGLTGSEPGRLSTACWRARPADGYSPACTLSRWKPPRSAN